MAQDSYHTNDPDQEFNFPITQECSEKKINVSVRSKFEKNINSYI